jgi:hypothetical protein
MLTARRLPLQDVADLAEQQVLFVRLQVDGAFAGMTSCARERAQITLR